MNAGQIESDGMDAAILRGINPLFDYLFGLSNENPLGDTPGPFSDPEKGKDSGA